MSFKIFKLNMIPDLTLNKYQSLSENGVEGVLKKNIVFLRQFHRITLMDNISMHLLFHFAPKSPSGKKLGIYLIFGAKANGQRNPFEKLIKAIKASPLSEFYHFEKIMPENWMTKQHFTALSILEKQERFLTVLNSEKTDDSFYTVPKWNLADNPRLYNLMKMMEAFQEECIYRVDLYPQDIADELHRNFETPLSYLRNLSSQNKGLSQLSKEQSGSRDPNADEALRQYEDWLKAIDESLIFYGRICTMTNARETAQILLDAAVAESIQNGNVQIKNASTSEFSAFELMDDHPRELINKKAPTTLNMWPVTYTLEEAASFFSLPALYDGENVEIPKETAAAYKDNGMFLGKDIHGYDINIPINMFKKHMFVCGVPGAGKTNTMLHLADRLWHNTRRSETGEIIPDPIPFLVLEPAKREYRELALFDIPELIIFSPSANSKFPLCLNPFEFPINMSVSEHINRLCQVFEGAFPMEPPSPFILERSIETIYKKRGWSMSDFNTGTKAYPTMRELYDQFKIELESTNYNGEIQGNIQSVLEMRIGSLLRREMADIFGAHESTFKPEEWLKRPVIMELEALGEGPANFITLLLCTLIREALKVDPMADKEKTVRHVIFIEEAHNLIAADTNENNGASNPKIAATKYIVKMLAEVRALREGIIIADQLPTAMAPEVIKNTNIKLVHRLTSGDDRGQIGETMSATALQVENMATFIPGQALVTYEGLLRPFQMNVHLVEAHGVDTPSDDELYNLMKQKKGYRKLLSEIALKTKTEYKKEIQQLINMEIGYINSIENTVNLSDEAQINFNLQCRINLQDLITRKNVLAQKVKIHLKSEFIDDETIEKLIRTIQEVGHQMEERLEKMS